MKKPTVQEQWSNLEADRQQILERIRRLAGLTKPWVEPPEGQHPNSRLPQNYQSIGSQGTTSLAGRLLMALFPVGQAWFQTVLKPEIQFDPDVDPDMLASLEDVLWSRDQVVHSLIENGRRDRPGLRRGRTGFHAHKRRVLEDIIITGEALEHMDEEFRFRSYRRSQYVTMRDGAGDVYMHIIKEKVDPLELGDKKLAKIGLAESELQKQAIRDRLVDQYTRVQWNPMARNWTVSQEINETITWERDYKHSPYFSTVYTLPSCEHYGRGPWEENYGDLATLNELSLRELQFAELASKVHPVIDPSSQAIPTDLEQESGLPLVARVEGGAVQDVAFLSLGEKLRDLQAISAKRASIEERLSQVFMLGSGTVRDSERTTAFEVSEVNLKELEGQLGGTFSSISESQHLPAVEFAIWQASEQGILSKAPEKATQVDVLTGVAALQRQVDASRLTQLLAAVQGLGEQALMQLDIRGVLDKYARYIGVDSVNVLKSMEQLEEEQRAAIAASLQQTAGEQAIQTTGKVVEHQAAQAAQ